MKKLSESLLPSADHKRFAVGVGTVVAWFIGGYGTAMLSSNVSAKEIIQTPVAIEVSMQNKKIVPKMPELNDQIVPITSFKVLPEEQPIANVKAGTPVATYVPPKHEDPEFEREYQNLFYIYQPKTNDQVILPVDMADLQLHSMKDNFWSRLSFLGKKDALTIYLSQHKKAKRFFELYQKRMIAWNNGEAGENMTVEKAINQEALFPFLKIQLVSNQTTDDMLKYLDARLSAKDYDIVQRWVSNNRDKSISADVAEVITQGILEQKHAVFMK